MRWLGPLLVAVWIVVSSVGRTVVLRRADRRLHSRVWTLVGLQVIRMAALVASFWVWFRLLEGAATFAIVSNVEIGAEPNLVLYCALAIVTTLGLFVAWGVLELGFERGSAAGDAARDLGVRESLRRAFRLGGARGLLVEINLVMGIVKIALIVLAMVFSATPLPFESVTTNEFLVWWWGGDGAVSCCVGLFPRGAPGKLPRFVARGVSLERFRASNLLFPIFIVWRTLIHVFVCRVRDRNCGVGWWAGVCGEPGARAYAHGSWRWWSLWLAPV